MDEEEFENSNRAGNLFVCIPVKLQLFLKHENKRLSMRSQTDSISIF